MIKFCKFNHLNPKGYSLLELMVASLIGITGMSASVHLFSFMNTQNKKLTEKRALNSLQEDIKRNLARDLKTYWLSLSNSGCNDTSNLDLSFLSFSGSGYSLKLLNNAELNTLIPLQLEGTLSNPLRTAINNLISTFGSSASLKCTDALTLQQSQFAEIGKSSFNQALCRCSTAETPYGTLNGQSTSFGNKSGIYSCIAVSSSPSDLIASETHQFSQTHTILVESSLGIVNVNGNFRNTCIQLAGQIPTGSLSQLEYAFYTRAKQGTANNSGNYKQSGMYLME